MITAPVKNQIEASAFDALIRYLQAEDRIFEQLGHRIFFWLPMHRTLSSFSRRPLSSFFQGDELRSEVGAD
jgi:hypothetical protein